MLSDRSTSTIDRRESLKFIALGASAPAMPQLLQAKGTLRKNGLKMAAQ